MKKNLLSIVCLMLLANSFVVFANGKKDVTADVAKDATADEEAVTINLYYTGVDGSAKKYVEEMISSGFLNEVRKAEWNIKYDYFFSADDTETVLLIDSWENREAIEKYHSSPLAQKIFEIQEKYNLQKKYERYKIYK